MDFTNLSLEEKRVLAEKDFEKGMAIRKIAKKYGVSVQRVKQWRARHNWTRLQHPYEIHHRRGAPLGNTNNIRHGLFSKLIPPDILEAMDFIDGQDPLDILWDQIKIQYATILRSQKIMYVANREEIIQHIRRVRNTVNSEEVEYEIQFPWDRQAAFLNAQSKAMSELRSLIKQYVELTHQDDERKLRLRQMQANIQKIRTEIRRLKAELANQIGDSDSKTIIVSDEKEMKKALQEQAANKQAGSEE